ncbi:MAG: gamma-glutamyl-gamma-aminobutyrate hydrolase family protein [Phycisphaerae bacterium]|nr:gamma-glutamyl-gamma-aminobutyrate hydrolase family protein [Phycisphaerae bacterium]
MALVVGLTCSLDEKDARARLTYVRAVVSAGGAPILLPPPVGVDEAGLREIVRSHLDVCGAIVLTGGPDPRTERYGVATHPAAQTIAPERQRYEEALLDELEARRKVPVLGVCLGMQLMALHAGGTLNQHLPDDTPSHADHMNDRTHRVEAIAGGPMPSGEVTSHHHQAVRDPGRLRIIARAPDGVIEAIDDPRRAHYVGVQWHPERTADERMGAAVFRRLVAEASRVVKRG